MLRLDQFLAALSDPIQREALRLLRRHHELCLCELIGSTGVSLSTMSRYVAALKAAGFVFDLRGAEWVEACDVRSAA